MFIFKLYITIVVTLMLVLIAWKCYKSIPKPETTQEKEYDEPEHDISIKSKNKMKTLVTSSSYVEGPDKTLIKKSCLNAEKNPDIFFAWIEFQSDKDFGASLPARQEIIDGLKGHYPAIQDYSSYIAMRTALSMKYDLKLPSLNVEIKELVEEEQEPEEIDENTAIAMFLDECCNMEESGDENYKQDTELEPGNEHVDPIEDLNPYEDYNDTTDYDAEVAEDPINDEIESRKDINPEEEETNPEPIIDSDEDAVAFLDRISRKH